MNIKNLAVSKSKRSKNDEDMKKRHRSQLERFPLDQIREFKHQNKRQMNKIGIKESMVTCLNDFFKMGRESFSL